MVTLGRLEWSVQVKNAAEAKEQAQNVNDAVNETEQTTRSADKTVSGLSETLSQLAQREETVGRGADELNAKFGFLNTAMRGVKSVALMVGKVLGGLSSVIIGGGIAAALAALALAFKKNFGGIRKHVNNFKKWITESFEATKKELVAIWDNFMSGFETGGGSLKKLESVFSSVLDGIQKGLERFWNIAQPIWNGLVAVVKGAAKVIGRVVGGIVNALSGLSGGTGFIEELVSWLTTLGAVAAAAWAAIQIIVPIASAVGGALGTLLGVVQSFIGAVKIGAIIVKALGSAILSLSAPVLAVIAVLALLAAAVYTNFGGIRDFIMDVLSGIKDVIMRVWNSLARIFADNIQKIVDVVKRHFGGIGEEIKETFAVILDLKGVLNKVLADIEPLLSGLIDIFRRVLSAVVPIWMNSLGHIREIIEGVFDAIASIVAIVLDSILTGIQFFLNVIQGDWEEAAENLEGLMDRTMKRIQNIIKGGQKAIRGAIGLVIEAITGPFKAAYNLLVGNSLIPELVKKVADILKSGVNRIARGARRIKNAILAPFRAIGGAGGKIYDFVSGAISGIRNAIDEKKQAVIDAAKGIKNGVVDIFSGFGEAIGDGIATAFNAVIPEDVQPDPIKFGGGDINIAGKKFDIPEKEIEFPKIDLPQLDTGGLIEKGGLAMVHEGERVQPAEVVDRGPQKTEETTENKEEMNVDIGRIEVGDQSLDLSKLTRRELEMFAEMVAEKLGDNVRNQI